MPNQNPSFRGQEGRYTRQTQLTNFGAAAQQKLQQAKVLVVGAGGLGVPVLQYLTGMGVGTIGLADNDRISLTNLHRQVLYNEHEVGQSKVATAANKLAQLNQEVDFRIIDEAIIPQNAINIIQDYDLVIDATDNFSTRYLLNDACVILNKPCIYGAVQQYEGHVSVFNYQGGPTYRCLYPKPPVAGEIPDCNTAGVLGVVPGTIGCQQALQAVKIITGVGKNLSGYLQIFDFLNDDQYKIKLKANPESRNITQLQTSYEAPVCNTVVQLSVEELYDWYEAGKTFKLIDVREADEFASEHLQGAESVPLSAFSAVQLQVNNQQPLVAFCQKGARSSKAAQLLQQQYPQASVYSVLGGMDYWQDEFDEEYIVRS
ncbi:HesA/MoeB/ThiF family protein [Mucilaginibacter sp. Bleaf8]|uniref:HesA/MoeB/ThiF family protein n=1 Tax=Mucilaginibacter sp. Bleaf8 TaxID=2834430 RepID=UPI001BD13DAE|nr:HesA/MoeB/ThiF family protein [Mucilaginibacter sp. Bleaf8]MBS7566232.1 HesA/MoeB/ThiF family protein [Mucilaginibacter sp. Bleaf8]